MWSPCIPGVAPLIVTSTRVFPFESCVKIALPVTFESLRDSMIARAVGLAAALTEAHAPARTAARTPRTRIDLFIVSSFS